MDNSFQEIWQKRNSYLYERLFETLNHDHNNNNNDNEINNGSKLKNNKKSFECITLPLTEVTVNLIEKTVFPNRQRHLGKLDVNYASYILHQACLSPTSIILAMIYLERVKKFDPEFLNKMSSSELFLASLIVALKFLFDKGNDELVYNDEWASFANLDLNDLNKLERDFLEALKWSCFVDPETFKEQVIKIEGLISMNEYLKRQNENNSMTYIEMISFFKYLKYFHKDNHFLLNNLNDLIQSILICTATYFIAIGIVMVSFTLVFNVQQRLLINSNNNSRFAETDNMTAPMNISLLRPPPTPSKPLNVSLQSNDFNLSFLYTTNFTTILSTTLQQQQERKQNGNNNFSFNLFQSTKTQPPPNHIKCSTK